ncbi:MAG: YHYH protein [Bacteroidota bacterium]
MKYSLFFLWTFIPFLIIFGACEEEDSSIATPTCEPQEVSFGPNTTALVPSDISLRGDCNQTLSFSPQVSISEEGGNRIISSNAIPEHQVGLFGRVEGALNPNAIAENPDQYAITSTPQISGDIIPLLNPESGPQYEFGILLNGVLLDPEAAEPFPHEGFFASDVNWAWNLDAMVLNLGLDCNNAHVQPSGKYHYHGPPKLYLESLSANSNKMIIVGYAADGFPIYYKYGYSDANDAESEIIALASSHQLKSGNRPGDGISAPCGAYNGVYTNDWEYQTGLGDLDECNGRVGVTPEYPQGTYYYIITDEYPFLPRCFKGSPSNDFKLR